MVAPVLVGCGPRHRAANLPQAPGLDHIAAAIEWDSAGDEAVSLLSEYLRVDTRNPPGNETDGARFLAAALAREGIPSQIHEYAPGRGSLVARLKGTGEQPPLCLLSHIDVVTWEEESWPEEAGPLSGVVHEGALWGRGALDMKGMGAIELLSLVWLKRLGVPLTRDVILVAVADEEKHNDGARFLVEQRWDELGCSHLVNEGGVGVRDALFEGQTIWGISVAEKGLLWVRMVATGEPGHGSTPMPGRAPEKLVEALNRVARRKAAIHWHPALFELFHAVGQGRRGLEKAVLTRPGMVRSLLKARLMGNPATAALLTNTVNLTGFDGAEEPNVEPGEVAAIFDCRLLPGQSIDEVLAELAELVGHDPAIRFEVLQRFDGNESPIQDPLYAALARHAAGDDPGAVVGPVISPGFTDSIFFREKGVNAYGFVPFEGPQALLETMHGNAERVPVQTLREGLRKLFRAIVDVSVAADAEAPVAQRAPEWTPVVWDVQHEAEDEAPTPHPSGEAPAQAPHLPVD